MNASEVMDESFDYAAQREYFRSAEMFQPMVRWHE